MNPDVFMQKAAEGMLLGPTDKAYKVYVGDLGDRKFYFQHLSKEQKVRFVEMVNAGLNIGSPGRFYVLPFFMVKATS